MSKRILQINSVVNWGSTGRITEEIGNLSQDRGWISYIAFGRNQNQSTSKLIKIGDKFSIYSHVAQTRILDNHAFTSTNATKALIKQIDEIKPDIIHLHNLHGYYLNIETLFTYLASVQTPVVWTLHDCWPFTGHCIHFDFVGCRKWETGCFDCPQQKEYPTSLFLDSSKKNYVKKEKLFNSLNSLTIVTVSNWLGEMVSKSFLKSHPMKVINNGIDLDCFKPIDSGYAEIKYNLNNKFVILGVATLWDTRKGLQDFIELSKLLDKEEIIVLVGLTKNQIKELPSNIIGIERTDSREDLAQLYSLADVFISTSVEETFGLVIVEAMACGTPVVVYNTTASPEVVSPDTGFIVERGDINGLLQSIKVVKQYDRNYYMDACVKRVRTYYNKQERYTEYIDLYDELINKKGLE